MWGLNLTGVFTTPEKALAAVKKEYASQEAYLEERYLSAYVYEVPLDVGGTLAYGMTTFISHEEG